MCSRLSKFGMCAPRMLGAEEVVIKMAGRPPTTLPLLLPTTTTTTPPTSPTPLSVGLHNAAMLAECGRVGLADTKWGMSIEGEPHTGIFAVQMDFTLQNGTTTPTSLDPNVDCLSGLLSPLAVGEKPTKIVKVRTTTAEGDSSGNGGVIGIGGDIPTIMVDTTYVHVCAVARKAEPMSTPYVKRLLTLEPHPLVSLPTAPMPQPPKATSTTSTTKVQFEIQKDHTREGGKGHLAMHMYPIYLDHVLQLQHTTTTTPKRVSIQYVKEIMRWEDTYLEVSIQGLGEDPVDGCESVCTFEIATVPRDTATPDAARVVAAKGTIVF